MCHLLHDCCLLCDGVISPGTHTATNLLSSSTPEHTLSSISMLSRVLDSTPPPVRARDPPPVPNPTLDVRPLRQDCRLEGCALRSGCVRAAAVFCGWLLACLCPAPSGELECTGERASGRCCSCLGATTAVDGAGCPPAAAGAAGLTGAGSFGARAWGPTLGAPLPAALPPCCWCAECIMTAAFASWSGRFGGRGGRPRPTCVFLRGSLRGLSGPADTARARAAERLATLIEWGRVPESCELACCNVSCCHSCTAASPE